MASVNDKPKTKPGVTGFVQEYNQEPGPQSDLNPDAVSEDTVLPEPAKPARQQAEGGKKRGSRKSKK